MWKFGRKIFFSIIIQFTYFILLSLEGYAMKSKSIFFLPGHNSTLRLRSRTTRALPTPVKLTDEVVRYTYSWREMISLFITIARNSAKNKSIYFIVYIIDCKAIIITKQNCCNKFFKSHQSWQYFQRSCYNIYCNISWNYKHCIRYLIYMESVSINSRYGYNNLNYNEL